MKRILLMVVAACFLIGLVASAQAQERLFLLDWIIYGKHAPFFAAKDFGFFKKEGLDLRIERGFGSGDSAKRVGAKAAPLSFADAGTVTAARVAGAKIVEVGMIHANSPYALYFLKEKAVDHPSKIKGWKLGSTPGDAARVVFPAFARLVGLDPKDVTWVDMVYAAKLPSLLTGKVDAIPDFTTGGVTNIAAAREAGKTLIEMRYGPYGMDVYSNGLIVHEDTIKAEPDLIRRFVKANMEAWAHCMIYSKKCLDNFYQYSPGMSKELVDGHYIEAINLLIDEGVKKNGLGWMDHEKMDRTVEIMTKYTPLQRRIKTDELYTNQFLPQVATPKM